MSSVAEALARIARLRAVVVGDVMLDAYVYGETGRVSREAPVLVVRKQRVEYRLGGAANTAANLAALGVCTTLVSAVGDDAGGHTLHGLLQKAGVTFRAIVDATRPTPVKTRILAGAVGTSKQQVLRLDEEPETSVTRVDQVMREVDEAAQSADVVIASDYGLGVIAEPLVAWLRARNGHTPVFVDSRHRLREYVGVTAVTPNVPEAAEAVGYALNGVDAVHRAGAALLSALACEMVLVTQGKGGMTAFSRHGSVEHVDIVGPDEVTDVSGAGDTVMATFASGYAAGLGWANAMRLANVAAGIVVTKLGTAVATPEDIVRLATSARVSMAPWEK